MRVYRPFFCKFFVGSFVGSLSAICRLFIVLCHFFVTSCHFFVTSLSASFSASFSAFCRLFIVLCHFFVTSLSLLCHFFVGLFLSLFFSHLSPFYRSLSLFCQLFVSSLSDFQERGHLNALVENGASVQSLASKLDDEVDICLCRMELLHEVVGCFHAAAGGQQIVVE